MEILSAALFVLIGYLAGSLVMAVVVCRILGHADPRERGSGNPGATNVLRLYGRTPALLTLAGDLLKGLLPVLLAAAFLQPAGVLALTGLAAFLGHLYPVFFHFQGGKGVATLIGVLSGVHWPLGLAFVVTWLLIAAISRYASFSALVAALLAPVYAAWMLPELLVVLAVGVMSLLLIWRHRSNIRNLLNGTEDKLELRTKL